MIIIIVIIIIVINHYQLAATENDGYKWNLLINP